MFPRFTVPRSLTKAEERRLLATVRAQGSRRDIALLTLALGTGLRLREIRGLNVGDVLEADGTAWRINLNPAITKGKRGGVAYLTGPIRRELGVFVRWKRRHGEPIEPDTPLFRSRQRPRLSLRQIQVLFRRWQRAAKFERLYPFHALRHTAITNVYRTTKDLYLTQRFARHASPLTTTIYTHPSDEELYAAIRGIKP